MLSLCFSQKPNDVPYVFAATGTKVYSIEEALFYVYHNWRLTADDFLGEAFTNWLKEIGLSFLATKVSKLAQEKSFTAKILLFLKLTDFFDESEIEKISGVLFKWESRRDYEKLKERADFFVRRKEPLKAIPLYMQAISFDENAALFYNLSVAYMQLGMHKNAYLKLKKAQAHQPANPEILLALTEAAIGSGFYSDAKQLLSNSYAENPKLLFLLGELAWKEKRHSDSISLLQEAIKQSNGNPHFIYTLIRKHTNMRKFDAAFEILNQLDAKDREYFLNEAYIHAASMDLPKAIKSIKQAIGFTDSKDASLYTKLAEYSRKDYNLSSAEMWIAKALELDPDNEISKLENAKIKKAQGKSRDYQMELGRILTSFKKRYRMMTN